MGSLYIHLPFCHHKCIYCDFYSTTLHYDKDLYIKALIQELDNRHAFIDSKLDTIYLGGGTPSLFTAKSLDTLFSAINKYYDLSNTKEITMELNCEDVREDYLLDLKLLGINRLSLGVESFEDNILKLLNRSHDSYQAIKAIEVAKKCDFQNISIDLISGLPNCDMNLWQKSLDTFLSFSLTHISCYTLMIEQNTMLAKLIAKNKFTPLTQEQALQQMDYTANILKENNYIHYETSSFCKQGYQSKHNMAYWTFKPYLGIGVSAHSYNGKQRLWNENNIDNYLKRISQNDFISYPQGELLTNKDKYNEYIMLSVRMDKGLNPNYVKERFVSYYDNFIKQLNTLIDGGYYNKDLSLTDKGWHLQNQIILALWI